MKRIIIFILLTFGITYSAEFYLMANGGLTSNFGIIWLSLMMFIPAICSILTRVFTKEGFKDMYLRFKVKENFKYYLLAWFGPMILTIIGAVVFFLVFPNTLDLSMQTIEKSMIETYKSVNRDINTSLPIKQIFLIQVSIAIFLAPLINAIPALGEELGWRGYLLPKLTQKIGNVKGSILTGVIWGIWHLPVIIMGHNYGTNYIGYPYLGIIGMTVFCVFVGMLISYISIKTKSAIPCAIAHGSLNGMAGLAIFFTNGSENVLLGPTPVGLIGGIGYIIVGIICMYKMEKRKE